MGSVLVQNLQTVAYKAAEAASVNNSDSDIRSMAQHKVFDIFY